MHKIYKKCTYFSQSYLETEPEARIKCQSFLWELETQDSETEDRGK